MKLHTLCAALALLLAFAATGRADPFSDIQNSPNTYWVPPPAGYVPAPGPYYSGCYGPPPAYYPPPPPVPVPGFFIHFHIH
jgi:hypothetical protein